MKITYKTKTRCVICFSEMKSVVYLPNYPITELYTKKKINNKIFNINQSLLFCNYCKHISLKNIINQNFFYNNYNVKSGTSVKYAQEYLDNFFIFIQKNIEKKAKKNLIIDIGGNDSSFLYFFKKNIKINIDPNASGNKNIIIIKKYLENVDFSKFKKNNKIYVSSHTIEHIPDINLLLKNISDSLCSEDLFFVQFPSLEKLIENSRFDQITHQHLNLYSLQSIGKLLNRYGLFIKNYEYDNSVYGTLRLCIFKSSRKNNFRLNINSNEIRKKFKNFKKFYHVYNDIIKQENNLVGFGAGMMLPSLKYYLPNLNNLKFILDNDIKKKNRYFINMKPQIKHFNNKFTKFRNYKFIISSISTENTLKKICKKLIENKIDFFIPFFKI